MQSVETNRPIRLLVVDDEVNIRESIRRTLSEHSPDLSDIAFAGNGQEALAKMAEKPADIVITDIAMPIMGGEELIDSLSEKYPATALVVLSGHWDQSTAFRQLGPYVRYLSKPVSQELLLWTVQQTIKEVRAGSEPLPAGAPALSGTPPNIPRQIFVRRGEVISAGDLSTGSSLQQFSPKAEIDLVLNRLKGFAEQRGITVTVQIDPELPQTIAGDSQHFRRRLLDFLTGAVRFTDRAEMELRVLKVMNREQIAVRFEC